MDVIRSLPITCDVKEIETQPTSASALLVPVIWLEVYFLFFVVLRLTSISPDVKQQCFNRIYVQDTYSLLKTHILYSSENPNKECRSSDLRMLEVDTFHWLIYLTHYVLEN